MPFGPCLLSLPSNAFRAPSPPHLLPDTAPFPLPGIASLSFIFSPFPSTLPLLSSICSLPAPPAPWHRLSLGAPLALGHRPSSAPAPSPFPHGLAKQDRTKGLCSVLFGRTKGLRSAMFGRTKALRLVIFDRTEAFHSVLFDRMVPEKGDAGGRTGLVSKSRRRMLEESICREVKGGFWKRGRRQEGEAVSRREKRMVIERRCMEGWRVWKDKKKG